MSGIYRLTPSARDDLYHLEDYTMEHFGLAQALALHDAMQTAFLRLAEHPLSGHLREDLSPAGRALRYWVVLHRFLIVYEPNDKGVVVIRILDGAQDLPRELASEG